METLHIAAFLSLAVQLFCAYLHCASPAARNLAKGCVCVGFGSHRQVADRDMFAQNIHDEVILHRHRPQCTGQHHSIQGRAPFFNIEHNFRNINLGSETSLLEFVGMPFALSRESSDPCSRRARLRDPR
jgi:hypothetical protein